MDSFIARKTGDPSVPGASVEECTGGTTRLGLGVYLLKRERFLKGNCVSDRQYDG